VSGASWAGKLLVATPLIDEPTFRRSVIAVLHHTDEGAVGVVLNRPSTLPVGEPFPDWHALAADPPVMFSGGPVADTAVVCLARLRGDGVPAGFAGLATGVGVLDIQAGIDDLRESVDSVRLFAGYAGWAADQLEGEVAEGAWAIVDAEPDDIHGDQPEDLWVRVLRRQAGPLKLMAWYPPDVSLH
jgi:putative transcriptional regulator